jgi:hypothetical protein
MVVIWKWSRPADIKASKPGRKKGKEKVQNRGNGGQRAPRAAAGGVVSFLYHGVVPGFAPETAANGSVHGQT